MFYHFFTPKILHPVVRILMFCLMYSLLDDLSENIYFVYAKLSNKIMVEERLTQRNKTYKLPQDIY